MSGYDVIPQEHIDMLKGDPENLSGFFDEKYGVGMAQQVLSGAQQPPQKSPEELSIWGRVKDAAKGIPYGVQEAANELTDSIGDGLEYLEEGAVRIAEAVGVKPFHVEMEDGTTEWMTREDMVLKGVGEEQLTLLGLGRADEIGDAVDLEMISEPVTGTGRFIGGVSQFVTGMYTFQKFTRLTKLRGAFANGALADAFAFDPKDSNLTKVIEDFGVDTGKFGDLIATNPDDPDYINRIRNAADGAIAGGIVEAIGWGIRAVRARAKGDITAAEEFFKEADEALKPVDEELAKIADEIKADAEETIKTTDDTFRQMDEIARETPDGQLEMDLGDVRLVDEAPAGTGKTPPTAIKHLTPEQIEKIRYQVAQAGNAAPLPQQLDLSWKSVDTAGSYEDVMNEIAGMAEVLSEEFMKMRGGATQRWRSVQIQSNAYMRKLIEATGRSKQDLLREFFGGFSDTTRMAATMVARENYVFTLGKQTQKLAQALMKANEGSEAATAVLKELGYDSMSQLRAAINARRELAANLIGKVNADRSNVARTLNAMKIARRLSKDLESALGNREDLFKSADAFAKMITKDGISADTLDAKWLKAFTDNMEGIRKSLEAINHFRINALLSGPGTQLINITSNLINTVAIPTSQIVGGGIRGDTAAMRHGLMTYRGIVASSYENIKLSLSAFYNKQAILDPFDGKIEGEDIMQNLSGPVNEIVSLPTRFLMMMDEFFKQGQYRGRLLADADMYAQQRGLTGEERVEFIKDYIRKGFDETGAAVNKDALLQAQKATFTEPLQAEWAKGLQKWAIDYPAVRFVVPFVRTPINILSQAIQHTPVVGLLSRNFRDDIAKGGVRAAQAYGKWVIGGSLIAAAGAMVSTGRITGSGPADPEINKAWLAAGNKPKSINLGKDENGNTIWFDYSRLEPLSNFFSITADFYEIMSNEYGDYDEQSVVTAMLLATAENTINKTFTQGIADFMDLLDKRDPGGAERALRNFASSFVPNIINQTNGDMAFREVRSVIDAIKAKDTRFNQLDPKRNVLGEIVWRDSPKWRPVGTMVKESDELMAMITKLAMEDRTIAHAPNATIRAPGNPEGEQRIDLRQVPYKPGQSLYDKWLEMTGTVEIGGLTLRERLEREIASDGFNKIPSGVFGGGPGTQSGRISKIIADYRKKAQMSIPEMVEIITESKKGRGHLLLQKRRELMGQELFPQVDPTAPSTRPKTLLDY